jgi:hypothetical protein
MLTSQDLSEIQKIIRKETKSIVQEETSLIVEKAMAPIKKDLKTIKSDMTQIRSDVKTIVNFFDKEYLELRKRVERIEEHLSLSPENN